MHLGNYAHALTIFDSLRIYTKAIECLDELDDNTKKFEFYSQKGQTQEALTWLYKEREILMVRNKFDVEHQDLVEVQNKIDRMLDDPKQFYHTKEIPKTHVIEQEDNTFKV